MKFDEHRKEKVVDYRQRFAENIDCFQRNTIDREKK